MSRFLAALLVVPTASACTPAMQDARRAMSPAERDAYMHYVNGGSGDCYQALDRHWPASSRQWGSRDRRPRIPQHPDRGEPSQHGPRLLAAALSLHSGRFSSSATRRRSGLTLM